MSTNEINIFLSHLKKEKTASTRHTKAQAKAFLQSVGVLTKSGNLTKPFKNICIPKGRAL